MAPTAPPARPHSAHPHRALPTGLFRQSSSPARRPASASGFGSSGNVTDRLSRETEWEDAWDSSSDKEDDASLNNVDLEQSRPSASVFSSSAALTTAAAQPIPIASRRSAPSPPAAGSGSISTSWVSASFHPTPAHDTPPTAASAGSSAGVALGSSANSAAPTTRALAHNTTLSVDSPNADSSAHTKPISPAPTRLPPGGAWEIVEPADLAEPTAPQHPQGAEAVRSDADDVLRDPMHLLAGLTLSSDTAGPSAPSAPRSTPGTPGLPDAGSSSPREAIGGASVERKRSVRTERRRADFRNVLAAPDRGSVDIAKLRRLAWNGIPTEIRPIVWQLLLSYLPLPIQPRLATLSRKRKEYAQLVEQYFGRGPASLDQQIWHQIEIDVPRTRPGAPLWSCSTTQRALERILYVWAIRHPASGYVQGINDLATPFFEVFLSGYVSVDPENFDVEHLPPDILAAVEADAFWCLTKLLDGIQDHYISQQPGIQRLVKRMGNLIQRIDAPLAAHFENQGVEYMQFAFRWMNCLLMREITVKCTIRMWDTYLSEGADAFSQFHLYVCCALLHKFSSQLQDMDFQEIIMFLQRLPTGSWTDVEIELLLSEAFVLKSIWHGADNHFANQNGGGGFGMMGR